MTPTIEEVEAWIGAGLPTAYRAFLAQNAEDVARVRTGAEDPPHREDVVLYGRIDFVEMNDCNLVKTYAPGHVTIGTDGGDRQFLLALDTGRLLLVDAGSLSPEYGDWIADDFAVWLAADCPLPVEKEPEFSGSDLVAIYVEQPLKALTTLVKIKEHLAIPYSMAELKKRLQATPCSIAEHLTYMQAIHACAKVNALEPCLGIRSLRDPAVRLPLVWQG